MTAPRLTPRSSALLLLLAFWLLPSCQPPTETSPAATEPVAIPVAEPTQLPCRPINLVADQPLTRTLPENGCDRFEIELEAGSFLQIEAQQISVDLKIELYGPGGAEPLVVVDSHFVREGDWGENLELLLRVAEVSGIYRVEIIGWEGSFGGYQARLKQVRVAEIHDRDASKLCELLYKADYESDHERYKKAEKILGEMMILARKSGALRYEAIAGQRLGRIHRKFLEDLTSAERFYSQSLIAYRKIDDLFEQSVVLNNLGRIHRAWGRMDEAVEFWEQARDLKKLAGDKRGEARSFANLGNAFRFHGQFQQALTAYDQAVQVLSEGVPEVGVGIVLNNRGTLYSLLGDDRQALVDHRRALDLAQQVSDLRLQADSETAIGRIQDRLGESQVALGTLKRALDLQTEAGTRLGRARTLRSLASAYEQLDRDTQARAISLEALTQFRDLESPHGVATVQSGMGRILLKEGNGKGALAYFREALDGFRQVSDTGAEIEVLAEITKVERFLGRPGSAAQTARLALEVFEEVRSQAPGFYLRSQYASSQRGLHDLLVELHMELSRKDPSGKHDSEALQFSERSRARSLLDFLEFDIRGSRQKADSELLEEEEALIEMLSVLESERLGLLDSPELGMEDLKAVEGRIAELVRELRSVGSQIEIGDSSHPQDRSAVLTVDEIQRLVLDEETLLLQYFLGRNRSYLWVVSTDSIDTFELPSQGEVERLARRAYEKISSRRSRATRQREVLSRLSDVLLGPAAHLLAEKRLLVVADGALHYLPFGVMPEPRHPNDVGDRMLLVQRHEIVTMPSASALAALRRRIEDRLLPRETVAVLADPIGLFEPETERMSSGTLEATSRQYKPLPFALEEAEAIIRLSGEEGSFLASGYDATLELATSARLRDFKIVHFATHGELNADAPELSQLVFSRFDREGRVLRNSLFVHQVFQLDLPVELVVASACSTALGAEVRGEGLIGLTQGFLTAGAARVLVSLWRVDDRATAELMERFYRYLLVERLAPASALRSAQLSIRKDPRWRAPYFWAGFVLQGEWRSFEVGRSLGAASAH